MKVVAIDFETANNSCASVCAVGICEYEDGCIEKTFDSLIRPEENVASFSPFNIQIHGIHPNDVVSAPRFKTIYPQLKEIFADSIVTAHNAKFDMECLKQTCLNCGLPIPFIRYFDTLELSRKVFPFLQHHRLNDVCEYLHIELDHHNAYSDANGCLMIMVQIMNLTGVFDIEELLEQCNVRIYEL